MTRAQWDLIKQYIREVASEEVEKASDREPGIWCGEPAISRLDREIDATLEAE